MTRALLIVLGLLAITAAPAGAAAPDKLTVRKTSLGKALFDGNGRALYLFTRDNGPTRPPRSRCYGDCAVAWPPLSTDGEPTAGPGVDADQLGTARRKDGKRMVTYNGHPLYYYVSDVRPGQVTCQDVFEYGGDWLIVSPAGSAIR